MPVLSIHPWRMAGNKTLALCFLTVSLTIRPTLAPLKIWYFLTELNNMPYFIHSQKDWVIPLFNIISDNFLFIFSQVH